MLFSLILSIHVVACVLVILAVLLQSGKGGGFAGILGGGGSDAVFSAPSGSQFIRKVTAGFAVAFFATSLLLTFLGARRGTRSVTREFAMPPVEGSPAPSAAAKAETAPPPGRPATPDKK